jgi:6-methylsalicylate decarboxylase
VLPLQFSTKSVDKVCMLHGRMPADLHQHLWPEALLAALARRTEPPRLRRTGAAWMLELSGEPPSEVHLADHDPVGRALLAGRDGVDLVGVASSVPMGLESLPAAEAVPLLDAFFEGVLELGRPFRPWAAPALLLPGSGALEIDDQLDRGALGACLPAAAIASEIGLVRHAALLERLEARDAPLLVHPGPARAGADTPAWWPAMTSYVAELQAAWLAWAAWGRAAHPRLRVVFAMLAGAAPLHAERLAARGGPASAVHDELAFFDVSSYGPRTVDAMLRVVGVDRLVYGSDRPVAEPPRLAELGPSLVHAISEANPARLTGTGTGAAAVA